MADSIKENVKGTAKEAEAVPEAYRRGGPGTALMTAVGFVLAYLLAA